MDQVCTEILAIDEVDKKIEKFANVFQWSEWIKDKNLKSAASVTPVTAAKESAPAAPKKSAKKLSFKEQHELDTMEETIQKAEKLLGELEKEMSQPGLPFTEIQKVTQKYQEQKTKVDALYARWQQLGNT
jgi:ATP-binding cassette subfamily F protein uup